MSRPTYSPAALDERLNKIERRVSGILKVAAVIAAAIVTAIMAPMVKDWIQNRTKKTTINEGTSAIPSPTLSAPQQPLLASPTPSATLATPPTPTITPTPTPKGKYAKP